MARERKTTDEYAVQGLYPYNQGGSGWEDLCVETNRVDAYTRLREYQDNEPSTHVRVVKRRVKKVG